MKKLLLLSFSLLLCLSILAQQPTTALSVIPAPISMKEQPGRFTLQPQMVLYSSGEASKRTAELLNEYLQANYGFKLKLAQAAGGKGKAAGIIIGEDIAMPEEAYSMEISNNRIFLLGSPAGLFYGLQTLQQLLSANDKKVTAPCVKIDDAPRFAYRGLMLDAGRYFFPVSYIKKYIDVMAQYKFNRFHWHLTEDQGWHIEIKKYPRLQEISSKRRETVVGKGPAFDGKPHGGYYTQEEVKDIVKYAADRYITIIPEIEMPGHSTAALAAYPNLGCTGGPYEVSTHWGVHKEVYCAGNDSVYTFLENVLSEVIDMFPSQYIHIGGDECPKDRWKECPKCQRRIKELGLKDEHALQSYFIQRIEKFVNSKGRRIIGWDEILEGGLAPNATVMSWRGEAGGIAAAKEKHDVIMSPNTYLYLDYYQGKPATEPLNIGGYLPLPAVYNYEPLPPTLSAAEHHYIKGVQANIWTEYIPNGQLSDYMTYPRALAAAEIAWSPASKKDLAGFLQRLPEQLARLDKEGVPFRIPEPVGLENKVIVPPQTQATITLQPLVKGAVIYYTTDGSEPGITSQRYTNSLNIQAKGEAPVTLKCVVVTPSGRKSAVYSATYLHKGYKAAATGVNPTGKGIRFNAYFRSFGSAKDINGQADSTGALPAFDINPFLPKNAFSIVYEGYIKVEKDGIYEFDLNSDDGTLLYIGDELVADNDGEHAPEEKTAIVPLRKGFHKVKLQYFNAGGGARLDLKVKANNGQSVNLQNILFN